MFRLVFAHEIAHHVVGQHIHPLHNVRDCEPVQGVGKRDHHVRVLGDPVCDDRLVVRLLWIRPGHHHPALLTHGHEVRVITQDAERRRERSGGQVQHDRQPHPRGYRQHLEHEREAGPCGCRRCAPPGHRRANARAHSGMFALHFDELGAHKAVGHVLGELLDDERLRGDRVRGDHVGLRLAHRVCDGFRAVDGEGFAPGGLLFLTDDHHALSSIGRSGTISMHLRGHSTAQIPHPLQ